LVHIDDRAPERAERITLHQRHATATLNLMHK